MASDRPEPVDLLGLDDPDVFYFGEGNPVPGTDDVQQLYPDGSWSFQPTPPIDSYDGNTFFNDDWNAGQMLFSDRKDLPPQPVPQWLKETSPASSSEVSQDTNSKGSVDASCIAPANTTLVPAAQRGLTEAQRQKLQSIAMPAHLRYQQPKSEPSPDSVGSAHKSTPASSPNNSESSKLNSRKRKSSAEVDEDDDEDGENQPVKKTAHNMIEKRYRTNLNDKIAALRDSVPSLRIMSKSARGEDTTEDREELQGLTPAHKLNKATVLSKATEYIRHLEKRNNKLVDENSVMQARLAAFEKLFMAGALPGNPSPMQQPSQSPPTPVQYTPETTSFGSPAIMAPSMVDPMMHMPENMKPMLTNQMGPGQAFPVPQQQFAPNPTLLRQQRIQQQQNMQNRGWQNAGPYFGKMMVGTMAGLMLMEAMRESEQSNETTEGRGLFALPLQLLQYIFSDTAGLHFLGYYIPAAQIFSSLKVVALIGSLLWAFVPSLFERAHDEPGSMKATQTALQAAPSLASPIHVRRQAWLTAIQTVWVPRHNFLLEAAAIGLKTVKLSIRNLIGVNAFQVLTGLTEEQELARVKAWTIALDAQLAGGDVEINKSRLTLTLLASGTLPTTPARLMLKALHVRVLLWEVGLTGLHLGLFDSIASTKARAYWNEAKQLHRLLTQLRRSGQELPDDELPDHLAVLLEQECDSVLNEGIVQRAHNLAWNRPTEHNAIGTRDGMDLIVEDPAVRSPLDAVAAWWSTQTLQNALSDTLLAPTEEDESAAQIIEEGISLAIKTAPIGSAAQNRALAARAVLFEKRPGANIAAVMQAIGPVGGSGENEDDEDVSEQHLSRPSFLQIPPNVLSGKEIRTSLLCSMAIAHLQKGSDLDKFVYPIIGEIDLKPEMSLLGYTSSMKLMERMAQTSPASDADTRVLERFAAQVRIWSGKDSGLEPQVRNVITKRCLAITRGVTGMDSDSDTGYSSMSSDDDDDEEEDDDSRAETISA